MDCRVKPGQSRNPLSPAQVQRLFAFCARQRLGNLSTFLCGHYRGRVEVKMEIFDLVGLDREPLFARCSWTTLRPE
jgi:hypothetical protein